MKSDGKTKNIDFSGPYRHGFNGMIILFVAVNLLGISGMINNWLIITIESIPYGIPHNFMKILAVFLILLSVRYCSMSFGGIRELAQFEKSSTKTKFIKNVNIFSIISAIWLLFSELFQLPLGVWVVSCGRFSCYFVRGPLFPLFVIFQVIGFVLLGISLLLWAHLFRIISKNSDHKLVSSITALFFGIAALCMIILFLYTTQRRIPLWNPFASAQPFFGFLLIAIFAGPSCILGAILFRRMNVDFSSGTASTPPDLLIEVKLIGEMGNCHFMKKMEN